MKTGWTPPELKLTFDFEPGYFVGQWKLVTHREASSVLTEDIFIGGSLPPGKFVAESKGRTRTDQMVAYIAKERETIATQIDSLRISLWAPDAGVDAYLQRWRSGMDLQGDQDEK